MCTTPYKVTIDTRERGLASILVTKIGTPSKLARIVFAALMEQSILENKHVARIEFHVDNLS